MEDKTKKVLTSSKGLLRSEELYEYLLETSVYPREPEPLKELRDVTATHPRAMMGTSPDSGQLMAMLLNLVNAKRTIEVGVFTGYLLLLTALTILDDGKVTKESFIDGGFLKTGDTTEVDEDGCYVILGSMRICRVIIT